mmetsp:Transcript_59679/g.169579  ORF Transcript_59679/g.169579 Transcript_59679/m.169579 type:complete len:83 (+) Transcript_59679:578-826(+)
MPTSSARLRPECAMVPPGALMPGTRTSTAESHFGHLAPILEPGFAAGALTEKACPHLPQLHCKVPDTDPVGSAGAGADEGAG